MTLSACIGLHRLPKKLIGVVVSCAALVPGCASAPPAQTATVSLPAAQTATHIKQIAGKWEGVHVRTGAPTTMTISEDGTYRAVTSGGEFVGQVLVSDGRFRFKSRTTGLDGTMTLYEGDGQRVLKTLTDNGSIATELRRARP